MGKGIHLELCKKLKFDHTSKWYMRKPESLPKNETQKIHWEFEMEIYYLIRPDDVSKQKTCDILDFAIPTDHCVKKRKQKRDIMLGPRQRTKNAVEHES